MDARRLGPAVFGLVMLGIGGEFLRRCIRVVSIAAVHDPIAEMFAGLDPVVHWRNVRPAGSKRVMALLPLTSTGLSGGLFPGV